MEQWIVVRGNPADGLDFFGPFEDAEAANHWADDFTEEWWVVELTPAELE